MRWNEVGFGRGLLLAAILPLAALGCQHGHHADLSEEELRERAQDAAAFISKRTDATDEQEQRLEQALGALVPELLAFRPERDALAIELRSALGAERLDPQRIEEIRKKGLSLADRASAKASQGLLQAARVLDQKQRARLIEQWERHRG